MQLRYGDEVEFLAVYVREAHPVEGWRMASNDRVGIAVPQPKTMHERLGIAETCRGRLEINMPLLVDEIDDRVGRAYSGMPDRLYLIDRAGKVAYKGGRGPFGFKPGELEQSISCYCSTKVSATYLCGNALRGARSNRQTQFRNHETPRGRSYGIFGD
jgi:hypothetical protein